MKPSNFAIYKSTLVGAGFLATVAVCVSYLALIATGSWLSSHPEYQFLPVPSGVVLMSLLGQWLVCAFSFSIWLYLLVHHAAKRARHQDQVAAQGCAESNKK